MDDGGGAPKGSPRGRPVAAAAGARPATVAVRESSPRWHARLCDEAQLTLPEAQLGLAALHALAGPGAVGGAQALVAVCGTHGLDDAVAVLDAWLDAHD